MKVIDDDTTPGHDSLLLCLMLSSWLLDTELDPTRMDSDWRDDFTELKSIYCQKYPEDANMTKAHMIYMPDDWQRDMAKLLNTYAK
jgi:hypothetical protein